MHFITKMKFMPDTRDWDPSDVDKFIKGTGCRHIQEVLRRMEEAGMDISEFRGTGGYEALRQVVETGTDYDYEAKSDYRPKGRN